MAISWSVLLKEAIRVTMAVQHEAQHATPHAIAQHPCVLQHNATTGTIHIPSIVPAAIGGIMFLGQHCCKFGVI